MENQYNHNEWVVGTCQTKRKSSSININKLISKIRIMRYYYYLEFNLFDFRDG